MSIKKCKLLCLLKLHEPIALEHLKPVVLGRSPITKIKEKRISKRQVELTANYETKIVKYKHLGGNHGGLHGDFVKSGQIMELRHLDEFEFLYGQFPHKIVFEPESAPNGVSHHSNGKRASDDVLGSTEKKLCDRGSEIDGWETFDDGKLLVYNKNGSHSKKVAAYDMDGTLITTASGKVFPKDVNDWRILYPEVPNKLKRLSSDGYKIVLFSNQAGVARGKVSPDDIQKKISRIIRKLGVSAQALISTGKGNYRKPMPGMWDFFLQKCNGGVEVDMKSSFYVGDAAGRPEVPKQRKKDHSVSDRLFALNVQLPFLTPEEHFLGHKPVEFVLPKFIPSEVKSGPLYEPESTRVPDSNPEVILLVGFPGCGKSTFVNSHLLKLGYTSVNRDTIGSWQKCVNLLESALKAGKSVVVDNTNPDRASRERYVEAARRCGVPVRCFEFNVSMEQAKHNNKFREMTGSSHTKINDMIYNMYKSKYEEPKTEEGFSEIAKVNFVPLFKNIEMEKFYKLYLLEK